MTRLWEITVIAGIFILALAVATLLGAGPAAVAVLANDMLVIGFGVLAALVGLVTLWRTSAPAHDIEIPSLETSQSTADETSTRRSVRHNGPPWDDTKSAQHERVTETIDRALERHSLGDSLTDRRQRSRDRADARKQVRETAIRMLAERHDVSQPDATGQVRDGTWTDDRRAGAFLAPSQQLPRRHRIVDWLFGVRYQRGLEAAVEEIVRIDRDRGAVENSVPESSPAQDRTRSSSPNEAKSQGHDSHSHPNQDTDQPQPQAQAQTATEPAMQDGGEPR